MRTLTVKILIVGVSCLVFSSCSATKNETSKVTESPTPALSPFSSPASIDFTARFEVYTHGTKRIFTDAKYHRQSTDVYIESVDPQLLKIKSSGVTWDDFFSTLPMSLTKDCLVTGTKQTFCSNESNTLSFYLNGQEMPDALDQPIQPNDFLRVEYSSKK